jgi:COP9 signalosome complex subunit 1
LILTPPATTNPKALLIARTALLRAIPHIKETWDHRLYLQCISQINQTLGRAPLRVATADSDGEGEEEDEPMTGEGEEADGKADMAWISRVKEEEKREMTKTEIDLRGYMSNLIKESIRVSASLCNLGIEEERLRTGDTPRYRPNEHQEWKPRCCIEGIRKCSRLLDESKSTPRAESGCPPGELLKPYLGREADNQTCLMFNNTQPLASLIGKLSATVDRAYPAPVKSKATGDVAAITANDIRQDQERRTQADITRAAVFSKVSVAEALVALQVNKTYGTAGLAFAKVNKAGLGDWDGQVGLSFLRVADDR